MNSKYKTLCKIKERGIVAVLRSETEEQAQKVTKACVDGGVDIIEITFSVPDAQNAIRKLVGKWGDSAVIGAGTVLDAVTARVAILSGAQFIVAPNFDKEVAMVCNSYGIPYIPGCMTINEIMEALKYGSDIIKLFPAAQYKDDIIKSIKAPIPQVEIMVTGGVDIDNTAEWIKRGAIAVGIGGNLTTVKNDDYMAITINAKKYIEKLIDVRK